MLAAAETLDQAEQRDVAASQQTPDLATESPVAPVPPPTVHPMHAATEAHRRRQAPVQVGKAFQNLSGEDRAELRKAVGVLLAARPEGRPEDAFDFSPAQRQALEAALGSESRAYAVLASMGRQTDTYRLLLIERLGLISKPPEPLPPNPSPESSQPAPPEPANQPV